MDFNEMAKNAEERPTDKKMSHRHQKSRMNESNDPNESRRTTVKMNPLSPNPLDVVSVLSMQAMHHDNSSSLEQDFNQGVLNRSMSLDLLDLDLVQQQGMSEHSSPKTRPVTIRKSTSNILSRPPNWIPNEHSKVCMRCQCKFTLFNWRHHCRKCGE